MVPAVNDRVIYRAVAGDCWDATVLGVLDDHPDSPRVHISVMGPGLRKPVELYRVKWWDDPDDKRTGARPRKDA